MLESAQNSAFAHDLVLPRPDAVFTMRRMTFREMREARGFSQAELARLSGVQQTTISQIERGIVKNPLYGTVAKLSKSLLYTVTDVYAAIRRSSAAA